MQFFLYGTSDDMYSFRHVKVNISWWPEFSETRCGGVGFFFSILCVYFCFSTFLGQCAFDGKEHALIIACIYIHCFLER